MFQIRSFAMALLAGMVTAALAPGPAHAQTVDAEEYWLDNGMQVLIVEKHETPTFLGAIVARVGSANETTGITGLSHLFEHMMFKGTEVIGTKDIVRDRAIMKELDRLRALMRSEERIMRERLRRGELRDMADPEAKTEPYRELETEFDRLIEEQRQLLIKNQLDEIYTRHGGSFLNAMTAHDMTMYMVRLPRNKLELYLWMESDRFLSPVFREFYAERDVVREERRLGVESTPTGLIEEDFASMFWKSSSYHWDVIGWPSDLDSITREQALAYYGTHYAPNNLTMILVGDLQPEPTIAMVRRYFERLPRGEVEPPEVVTLEERQYGEKRLLAEAESSPKAEIWYHSVAWKHPDSYTLEVLAGVLGGKTGRLYEKLVEEKGIAKASVTGGGGRMMGGGDRLAVGAVQESRKYAGAFQVRAEGVSGVRAAQLEEAMHEVIAELATEPVTPEELQKAKNQLKVQNIRLMDLMGGIGSLFLVAPHAARGDWAEVNNAPAKLDAVTAEDIRRVVDTYFVTDQRSVLLIDTKATAAGEQPKPGGGSMAAGMIERIRSTTDKAQLEQMIEMMGTMMAQVEDPEKKTRMEQVVEAAQQRLDELEAAESGTDKEKK